jgi:hypothetical protein
MDKQPTKTWGRRLLLRHKINCLKPWRKSQIEVLVGKLEHSKTSKLSWGLQKAKGRTSLVAYLEKTKDLKFLP